MENHPEFLKDEKCDRCHGPILAEACKKTVFVEETLDYVSQTVWICYHCGKENTLDSEPHYIF